MNGSPPRIPKKLLPRRFAAVISRSMRSASMKCRGPSTFTQQPWQRRLQLLMIEI
jgi:hypothetical protein